MDYFQDAWQQNENQFNSSSQELQSITKIIPTIAQSQRDEYQQQANECLRNIERSLTELTQLRI